MSEKVKAQHLERGAYVYVRQSTPYQVRNNLESKERQYALEGRAQQLGFSKVVVIDEDLGRSGSGIQERPGFGRLLASVCQVRRRDVEADLDWRLPVIESGPYLLAFDGAALLLLEIERRRK